MQAENQRADLLPPGAWIAGRDLGPHLLREVLALDEHVLRALHHVGVREDEVLVVVETEFLAAHLLRVWVVVLFRDCLGFCPGFCFGTVGFV